MTLRGARWCTPNARGFLTRVTGHDGVQRLYTYTEAGLLHTVTEPDILLENAYDGNGRCIRQINRFPGRDRPFVFDFSYLVDNDRVRQTDVHRSDGTWTSSTYGEDGIAIEEMWGQDGIEPTAVSYERDPTTSVVIALTVTCTSRGGM
jgi:YD repeat-containing protein